MTFKMQKFRVPAGVIDHVVDIDDVLRIFDAESVLKALARNDDDFEAVLFEFIDAYYVGSFESFVEKFKPECE